jgi:hypothetical protein
MANPTPTLPSTVPPSICDVTPITWPSASSSGPPELPWLIAVSVWIASGMVRPSGAWMSRPVALTMPAVIVRWSPNGLPIAYTGSPGCVAVEAPNASGCRSECGADTRSTARSLAGSVPTTMAG